MTFTKWDYCPYLLGNHVNFTLTHLADPLDEVSHDTITRYLAGEELKPQLLWENVQSYLPQEEAGYLDKRFSTKIEPIRRQWSGNAHAVIRDSILLWQCWKVQGRGKYALGRC